jgi:glucan phosphoethanolaminetransferase (alkaline phosphatase superfamily)
VLSQPYRSPLPKVKRIPGYNILVILGESSRATSSFAHGYAKATNPFQTEFLKKNNGIIFKRFYSVCTRTMLSFPSFLTGVSPSQSMGLLHRQPTIFNYAKSLDSINTFLISSQSYDWGNFRLFIKDASLDYLYTREDIPFRQTDDMPLQDSILPLILDKHLNSINTPYVGMLQFFITHYPYNSFPQDRIFGNDSLSKYNASTRSLDRIIAKVIDVLKSHKLIDNTIIIFTSDHGEAFNEHGYSGHLHTFYNEEALVPAWLFIPEALIRNDSRLLQSFKNAHANSNLPMSNIDIVPTVMDLLGIWNDNDLSSFRRELTGSPATLPVDTSRVILMQNYNEVDFNTMFVGIGLVHGRQKYLLHTRNNMLIEELYDIYSDPSEKNNIITLAHSTRLSFFHSQLRKYPATKSLLNKFLNRKN